MKRISQRVSVAGLLIVVGLCVAGEAAAATPVKIAGDPAPRIEVVFALDTTGSMSGLISAAKEKIWSIASSMAQAKPTPHIKIGLVAYRDRGDDYVTMRTDLTEDLDSVYGTLMDYQAEGGGDGPESVNQALHEAVSMMSWSKNPDTYKTIFLVGDFPPHMDYDDDVPYQTSCKNAASRGIVINAVQCGGHGPTVPVWEEIARLSDGDYFQVEQSGGAVIASTPYDEELARLGRELDDTRLYYGGVEEQRRAEKKKSLSRVIGRKASSSAKARRAVFNASAAGKDNFSGDKELVSAVESGAVALDDLKDEELPEELKGLSQTNRKALVEEKKAKRKEVQSKIEKLSKKRRAHIDKELAASADGGKGALSQKMYDSVRKQAAKRKINFDCDMAAH